MPRVAGLFRVTTDETGIEDSEATHSGSSTAGDEWACRDDGGPSWPSPVIEEVPEGEEADKDKEGDEDKDEEKVATAQDKDEDEDLPKQTQECITQFLSDYKDGKFSDQEGFKLLWRLVRDETKKDRRARTTQAPRAHSHGGIPGSQPTGGRSARRGSGRKAGQRVGATEGVEDLYCRAGAGSSTTVSHREWRPTDTTEQDTPRTDTGSQPTETSSQPVALPDPRPVEGTL